MLDYIPQGKYYAPDCRFHEAKYGNLVLKEESERNTKLHVTPMKDTSNGSANQESISKRRNERIRYNNLSREEKHKYMGKNVKNSSLVTL